MNTITAHLNGLTALANHFGLCECLACREAAFDYSNAAAYWGQALDVYSLACRSYMSVRALDERPDCLV
jgi:hypothetical protein